MSIQNSNITAVILAGGKGRRMGGIDKGLIEFEGRLLIETVIDQLKKQQLDIVINANRNQQKYHSYGYPVIADELKDYQGPLAGFMTAMASVKTDFILTLPCDSPMLVNNFAARFIEAYNLNDAPICVAHDGERLQPVHALIATSLVSDLNAFLQSGERKIDRWYAKHEYILVDFSDVKAMFENINTPEDQHRLQRH